MSIKSIAAMASASVRDLYNSGVSRFMYVDTDTETLKFGAASSGTTEKEVVDTTSVQAITGVKTFTAPVSSGPVITDLGTGSRGVEYCIGIPFVEQAGATLTGSVPIPAGAWVTEISFVLTVLFTGAAAVLKIGDAAVDNGYFTAVDCKATDLVVGEVLSTKDDGLWGGKAGAYLTAAGRRGMATGGNSGFYYGVADTIKAIITMTTPLTIGRGFLLVKYVVPTPIAAVVA